MIFATKSRSRRKDKVCVLSYFSRLWTVVHATVDERRVPLVVANAIV